MVDHPIPAISNPQTTTTAVYSGDVIINLRELLTDIDLSPLFESWRPLIRTQFLFRSGKFAMTDPDQSNEIHLKVEEIVDEDGNFDLTIPAMSASDHLVLAEHPQILENKVLGTGTAFVDDIDLGGNSILNAVIDPTVTGIANINIAAGAAIATAKLADSALFAFKNAANTFTTAQKIQYNFTSALTLFRNDNVQGNGTGISFNFLNDAVTPAEVSYAAIFGTNVLNDSGAEQGAIAFFTRNGASFIERMALDHLGKLRVGPVATGLLFDWTGITSTRTITFPNENIKVLGELNTAIVEKKTLDVKKNTFLRIPRTGRYYCAATEGVDADGQLYGLVGLGAQQAPTVNTAGKYHIWHTQGGVANDAAGVVKLDGFITRRRTNPLLRFAFLFVANTSNNRRVFKGWTQQRLLTVNSDTAPLNSNEHGFLFGHGSTDTNFHIFHNDATGTCVKTDTTFPIPAVNTNYIVELQFNDSPGNVVWTIYSVVSPGERGSVLSTGTINTRIPTTDIGLFMQDLVIATDTSTQANNIHYIEVT